MGLGLTTKVTSEVLALGQGVKGSLLDGSSVFVETHVLQHHDTAQQQGGRVGETLALDVGGGTVDGLEDGALVTNVTGGGETKTTDQTGAHVGQNVTVQVGHDKDLVVVGGGVGDDLQARVVQQLSVELDIGEVLGDVAGGVQEQTVGHLHDGGLVHHADLLLVDGLRVLEGEAQHTLGSLLGDELDALHHTVDNNVLNAGVFTLGVLTDQDGVDTIVGGLVASNGAARTDVGEQVEGPAQSQVQGDVTLTDGGGQRTLKRNVVLLNALDGVIGNGGLAILQDGGNIDGFPLDRGLELT